MIYLNAVMFIFDDEKFTAIRLKETFCSKRLYDENDL